MKEEKIKTFVGFHYSFKDFNEIKTKRQQGCSNEVVNQSIKVAAYRSDNYLSVDSVSVFLHEIPKNVVDLVGKSSVWIKGKEIMENKLIINSDNLIYWTLESSSFQLQFMEDNYNESMNREEFKEYLKRYKKYSVENKLEGNCFNDLFNIVNNYNHDLTKYFELMPSKGNQNQYASTVPHLIIEIKKPIKPELKKKIII